MKTYSYTEKLNYFVNRSKDSKSVKQAWYFFGKAKNLTRWYELTDEQVEQHKLFMEKYAKAIERKWASAPVQQPKVAEPKVELPKVVQPEVSKNGRTNNALRVKAVIANLEASISILKEIK